ncbi:MAG: hypothetical protein Q9207_001408 [Kuettlingeria erythrocarpa]
MASKGSKTTTLSVGNDSEIMELRLASGNGPVTLSVLRTPARDALPSEIPVIDISPIFSSSLDKRKAVARQIHDAAVRYDPDLDSTIKDPASIPEEAAQYIGRGTPTFENTEQVPHFEDNLKRHYQSCLALAWALTRAFALSLDFPEDAFDSKVQYPDASMQVNFYPPIAKGSGTSDPEDPNACVSIGSHTDFLLLTMLWQDNVGGLQVLNLEGQWIAAHPIEGTLVVNIGDYLQRITNDNYVTRCIAPKI